MKRASIKNIYKRLFSTFGPQGWWPADDWFEVATGAILTQNTSWNNVAKAIDNLKRKKLLTPGRLYRLSDKELAFFIRPTGYYNIKARRLKSFLNFLFESYGADIKRLTCQKSSILRQQLLSVNGIGQETADSILLYALNKAVFVIDAYTRRIFLRQGLIEDSYNYDEIQNLFLRNLNPDPKLFNEYHALIVKLGKDFCLKNNPKCRLCPLSRDCRLGRKRIGKN